MLNIWQRLAHRLFGWHYVHICIVRTGWKDYNKVSRVYLDGDGRPYAMWCSDMVYLGDKDRVGREYGIDPLTFPRAAMEMNAKPADVVVLPRQQSS